MQHPYNLNGVKNDAVFRPVEHPMEPPDEDHPVQCPMPESSVINVRILSNFSLAILFYKNYF